jgi:hypothetical protein
LEVPFGDIGDNHAGAPDVLPDVPDDGPCPENLVASQRFQARGHHDLLEDMFVVAVERLAEGHQDETEPVIDLGTVDHTLQG